ncbi:MAG: transglycosylase SLT domain-containing protein [Sterolibacterium sp.]|nr:transglycosylase SLT domain-containing protein [Sterolibacterium sp.]MBP9799619.1 transglycosylase SLT domain-containing protein [Sterolibacterium sp.]
MTTSSPETRSPFSFALGALQPTTPGPSAAPQVPPSASTNPANPVNPAPPPANPPAPSAPISLSPNKVISTSPPPLNTLGGVPLEIHDALPPLTSIDLITPPDDLWQRVRNGFSMANLDNPLVAERQAWYLNRPELLKGILNRSSRYLFYIVGELEKRGMPTELALLPMVESAYNPRALSPAQAAGLWQFIPSTGRNYRLEQDWWQDQRRDIIASTGAALDYLQTIYEMHGDWHLALASYNWGEAAVARAIAKNAAKNLPTDYAHINMPQETRYYVPKLQALKNIIARPDLFGIKIDPIPNQPYFDTVNKTGTMDVTLAAKLAEMPLNEFLALNPSYNRPVMPAGKDSPIILPTDRVQTFLDNLEQHKAAEKPLSNWTTHTLKKGERLDKIAARFHIPLSHLKQINGISSRTQVRPGNTLLVPGKALQAAAEAAERAQPPQETSPTQKRTSVRSAHRNKGSSAKSHGKTRSKAKVKATARSKPAHKTTSTKKRKRR